MKILVFSDTHGDLYNLKKAVESHKNADVIIHCGDSHGELDDIKLYYPNKMYVEVKGNCDLGSPLPPTQTINLCEKKIFVTHGHLYNAKMTLYNLCCAAREQHADILLFGHTHQAYQKYDDGLYILNPGSCNGYNGTYGIIEISKQGIITNIVNIK